MLNFIDAFDLKKSEYRYNEKYDFYTFIPDRIYLNKKNYSSFDIFRCEKSLAGIYVSEKFYSVIIENKFSGSYFEEQL